MSSIKYPCYLEISDSGRYARLVHKNQTVIAEFLVSGNLDKKTQRAHVSHLTTLGARPKPFQAEIIEICEYEQIDSTLESITLKPKG